MKKLALTLVGAWLSGIASSHGALYLLSGTMDPLQAGTNGGFGGGTGSGAGTIEGTFDDESNELSYTISWANLTSLVTNMHFHVGAPGVSGGVALGVPGPWASPQSATGIVLDATQESQLLGGDWYVNIHTGDFSGGEIRGQVGVAEIPEPGGAVLALAGLSLAALRRRR